MNGLISISTSVLEILQMFNAPTTLSKFNQGIFKIQKRTAFYFLNRLIRLGLIDKKFDEHQNLIYKKSDKTFKIHEFKDYKYHFIDQQDVNRIRNKEQFQNEMKISEETQILLYKKIIELKHKKASRSEICKKLGITRTQLINIYLFHGVDDSAGSRCNRNVKGNRTTTGASATNKRNGSTATGTKNNSKILRQSAKRSSIESSGDDRSHQCDEPAAIGAHLNLSKSCTQSTELAGEQDHRDPILISRNDNGSNSLEHARDQRAQVLSNQGTSHLQNGVSASIRPIQGGHSMKAIGVKLKNIHTGKMFELWFDNEMDMILNVGLFCKKDFEFVEKIIDD